MPLADAYEALPGKTPADLHVLLVDDEDHLRQALVEAFRLKGYRVTPASSAQEALAALRAARCDVLVTDLMLPDMDGIALMERTRLMQPGALVILMTGQGTVDSAVKALKGGAYDYILKPFRLDEIFLIVSRGLEQQRLRQENLQLNEINRRLQELDQIKSDLLSTVTHEFRTPLAILHGWLDLFLGLHLGALNPDQTEGLSAMKQGAQRLGRLIGNLLAYVEFDQGEISLWDQEVSLPDILRAAVQNFEPEIKDRALSVTWELDPALTACWLDPEKVTILFGNLVENAVKFNEPNGQLRVAARVDGDDAEVTITNTGVVIPAEGIARLLEPFTQGDMSIRRPAGGLGLGLAVARAIVDAYRGHIAIESGRERGTTVRVRLPQRGGRLNPLGAGRT